MTEPTGTNRREFLKTAAVGGAVAANLGVLPAVHAAGSDTIKVGLIGCGGRGTGAAEQSATSAPSVKLVAMGDLFKDHLESSRSQLRDKLGSERMDVPNDRCFTGWDAYKQVIDSGVDIVILATPPGFRPMMIEAAVKAGKNLFTEKPVGVDGTGIRRVLAAYEEAKSKGLGIVAGTQRRHQAPYLESMKRIHNGEIGDITSARAYWNQGALWVKTLKEKEQNGWSDMEWQVRNWLYFTWLSGDHICEQHVHNLDVCNWALNAVPVRAVGLGGRQVRTGKDYGNIYDHFAIDYEYPRGVHVASYSRQQPNTKGEVSEAIVGTKGSWTSSGGIAFRLGRRRQKVEAEGRNPYEQEHTDLVESLRAGKPLNELKTVAESTLTAIMGRMAAYTGQEVTWDQALNSKLDLMPKELAFGPLPVAPVAQPGETELI
jgi:myo-inositol 2-dehydrogenase/D-chiro-inositol 1-dehydrogenase